MSEFGPAYAELYDLLYSDKNYKAECDTLERAFRQVRSVIDLGCGTGNHAVILAARGYTVVGVDRSPEMLERARSKKSAAIFEQADARTVRLGRVFDAAILMFNVIGYQLEDADVRSVLRTVREHLRPSGVLFFDFWYGPSVLKFPPEARSKERSGRNERVVRHADGRIDRDRRVCSIRFRVERSEGGRPAKRVDETHLVRYFFPEELERFLSEEGFRVERIGAFPEVDREPGGADWNACAIAGRVP